jgi:hypothetical protein
MSKFGRGSCETGRQLPPKHCPRRRRGAFEQMFLVIDRQNGLPAKLHASDFRRLMKHAWGDERQRSPWYIVPADDKENARLFVSHIVLDTLDDLKMSYPQTTEERRKELLEVGKSLEE